jgi:hypothetical protein
MHTPNQETSIPDTKASELSDVRSLVEPKPISNEPLTPQMTEDSKVVYSTIGDPSDDLHVLSLRGATCVVDDASRAK